MDNLYFVAVVLGAAMMLFFLYKKLFIVPNSFQLFQPTIPAIFLMAYFILMSVPSIFWFYTAEEPIKFTYFLALQSVLISFPIGVSMASLLFRRPSKIINLFLDSKIQKIPKQDFFIFPIYLVMATVSIIVIIGYILTSDYIPLFGSFSGYGEVGGEFVRFSIYRTPQIIQYAYALTVRFILPFCLLYTYFMAAVYRGKWRVVFYIILAWSLFCSALVFERSNVLGIFILLGLASYFRVC